MELSELSQSMQDALMLRRGSGLPRVTVVRSLGVLEGFRIWGWLFEVRSMGFASRVELSSRLCDIVPLSRSGHLCRRIPTEGGDVSSVTPVVVSGLPGWLECTAFPVELRQRVQEELEILGLVQSPVVALLWPASASVTKKKTLRRGYSTASALRPSRPNKLCEESGISLSIRLVSDSPWPLVKSVALDCNMEFGRDIRQTTSHISDADWAEDVTSARQHWQQQLLAGLSKYTENLEVQLPRKALSSTSQTFASRTSPEESLWRKHGPKALAILLSELIVNGAMHDAATHLEGTMLETMRSNLPFFPEGPLDFEEHFPPLQLSDAYIETEKQRSPELLLGPRPIAELLEDTQKRL